MAPGVRVPAQLSVPPTLSVAEPKIEKVGGRKPDSVVVPPPKSGVNVMPSEVPGDTDTVTWKKRMPSIVNWPETPAPVQPSTAPVDAHVRSREMRPQRQRANSEPLPPRRVERIPGRDAILLDAAAAELVFTNASSAVPMV